MANGGIIGPVNTPTSTTATGVWQQEEQYEAVRDGTWPERPLFTTKSLRFNSASSENLTRTPSSASNRKTFTFSFWFKRSKLGVDQTLFSAGVYNSTVFSQLYIDSSDKLFFQGYDSSGNQNASLNTSDMVFRDVSAWYHIVVEVDTTQSTSSNRVKIYVNNSQITFGTNNYPSQNYDYAYNNNDVHKIGGRSSSNYFNGYMSEVILIDGQALDPTSFGSTNSDGVWIPAIYTGTFGTNGFNLQFENAAALGTDSSPNGNTFTVNNLTSIDQSTDYPEVNFATLNPLIVNKTYNDGSLAEGNTYFAPDGRATSCSTIGVTSGKWYVEFKTQDVGALSIGVGDLQLGIQCIGQTNPIYYDNNPSYAIGVVSSGSVQYNTTSSSYGGTIADNDIVGLALDMDNHALYFSLNGTFMNSGDPTSGATKTNDVTGVTSYNPFNSGEPMFIFVDDFSAGGVGECFVNFGSPSFAISSGNTDGNGYGNFEYAVPSGYYSLNTKNLAEFG